MTQGKAQMAVIYLYSDTGLTFLSGLRLMLQLGIAPTCYTQMKQSELPLFLSQELSHHVRVGLNGHINVYLPSRKDFPLSISSLRFT